MASGQCHRAFQKGRFGLLLSVSRPPRCLLLVFPDRSPALATDTTTTAGGVGMQRPGTTLGCSPDASTPNSTGQGYRPQTSPAVDYLLGPQGGAGDAERGACRSPPQRMRSRLFLQSAMDLSLANPSLSGGGTNGGGGGWGAARGGGGQHHQQERRPGVASAAETSRQGTRLNSASCSALQPAGGTGGLGRGLTGQRPSTSLAVPTSNRSGGGGVGGGGEPSSMQARPASRGDVPQGGGGPDADGKVAAWGSPHTGHQVIDLGVVSDAAPRPRVWGDRQLGAAAAAAAGRTRKSEGVGGGFRAGVTKRGVVLDARFAKVRKTLRRDVLEAAERARLPLLQA